MSLQPSADESAAVETTKQMRPILAWGLLGANAVFLLFALQALLIPGEGAREDEFAVRAFNTLGFSIDLFTLGTGIMTVGFLGVLQLLLPVVAVLLTTHVKPAVSGVKTFLLVALGEIGVSLLFGLVAFFGAFSLDEDNVGRLLTETAFFGLAMFALFGIAAFWMYKIAQPHLQSTPNYGGGYGQQQGGWPAQGQQQWPAQGQQQAWPQPGQQPEQPQQQAWPQQPAQPQQPQPGQPQPGQQQWPQQGQPGQQQGGWPQG
ncbi:MAG: hypothetical protein HOQ05_03250 [Corynebacteriales bacterium]|nr:hypothetical protein [Mycobacteriales bacterium]